MPIDPPPETKSETQPQSTASEKAETVEQAEVKEANKPTEATEHTEQTDATDTLAIQDTKPVASRPQLRQPWALKAILLRLAPFLGICMFASFVGLVISIITFAVLYPSGGLFVLSAETTRLEYEASGQTRGEIWLDGVLIRAGGKQVVDANAHPAAPGIMVDPVPTVSTTREYFCYTGAVTPGAGAWVELTLLDGAQFMQITPAPEPNPGDAVPKPTTLRFNGRALALTNEHQTRSESSADASVNALMLVPQGNSDDNSQGLDFGDFELPGRIEIFADPDCKTEERLPQGFGRNGDLITIDGPAILGRKLRRIAGDYVVDDGIPFLTGSVEVFISQVLCANRLFSLISANAQLDGDCDRIYRIEAEPMTLPAGAAILSEIQEEASEEANDTELQATLAPFFGQVVFDDGRYHVNASTEAESFFVLRPGTGGKLQDGNALSVPFIDRVLLEPSLIILTSVFFSLSGLVLGILQIENADSPDRPAAKTAS